jgi:hypothetical protein
MAVGGGTGLDDGKLQTTIQSGGACPVRVKSGNAHNEPMMSAFQPIATEQRTLFYVGFVPKRDSRIATIGCAYSINSSALVSRIGGTVRPSAFAVLRLMMNSNLLGNSTGRSAGFAPLRILSTRAAARLYISVWFGS